MIEERSNIFFKKKLAKLLIFLNKMNFHMKINPINKMNNVKKKLLKNLYKTSC